jgi:uncharacterized protein involved in cysteine biosynthesis
MLSFLKGIAVFARNRRLWGYSWKPLLWATLLYVLILAAGQLFLVPRLVEAGPIKSWLGPSARIVGSVAFALLWLVAANFIVLAISSIFSSFFWGKLSKVAEESIYGSAPDDEPGWIISIWDSALRLGYSALVGICALIFIWLGPFASAAAAAILSLLEFSAPAYLRRRVWFPAQLKVYKTREAIGFMVCSGIVSLAPLLFVLAMPAMVVGGTILCREAETVKPYRSGNA